MHLAASSGSAESITALINAGADIFIKTNVSGHTAYQLARLFRNEAAKNTLSAAAMNKFIVFLKTHQDITKEEINLYIASGLNINDPKLEESGLSDLTNSDVTKDNIIFLQFSDS